ncbi:Rossmann-like and DUF2520 domain-containing protein [Sphingopyxis sp. MWB1]|uniref:Rossmann-like and DUF2520 domain-containing protein n=1 Tax=Sphingopyxis sp. MWB1 TaxID=1537715 RepID=UPI00051A0900|nr:Rossmann-like and DUF2520 domain-containing protein [Sphingopyxis sp. MWB1]
MNDLSQPVGIVGAGRVGQALALGLAAPEAPPPLLWTRSAASLKGVLARVPVVRPVASLGALAAETKLIALAVSDDALEEVVRELAWAIPEGHAPFVFHVSGRSGADILAPLAAAGALTAAVHPVMTFTGEPQAEVARMARARFAITGSSPAATLHARDLVARLKGVAVEIGENQRPLYHAALCHASNHLVTLMADASEALVNAGVEEPGPLLAPLVRAALANSLSRGFSALSGPILRGDAGTIADHLAALEAECPALLPAYRAMACATLDRLERDAVPGDRTALRQRIG